jgi:hypothetical protein
MARRSTFILLLPAQHGAGFPAVARAAQAFGQEDISVPTLHRTVPA